MSRDRSSRSHSRVSSVIDRSRSPESIAAASVESVELLAASERTGIVNRRQPHGFEASSSTLAANVSNVVPKAAPSTEVSSNEANHDEPAGSDDEERLEREERESRPVYRRPSAWWMLGMVLPAAIATSTTIAPRVEIFTKLVCEAIRPDYETASVFEFGITQIVQPPSKLCAQDPDVQAAVARLMTLMTVSMGVLSCLSTGWWGQLSDRYGRMPIIRVAACGLLIADVNFILVALAAKRLPGGYRFMLVGPIIDGLFGGMTTLMAGFQAYISDCTSPAGRSRIFSLNLGLMFAGMAIGPTLGSLMVRATNDLLSVFYLAAGSHVIYTLLSLFIIPESLTRASMRRARKRKEALQNEEDAALEHADAQSRAMAIKARVWRYLRMPFVFMAPMGIFLPLRRPEGKGWDFNLTLLILSAASTGLLMGSYQFIFQYAQKTFGWNSEILGYWLSVVGVTRAANLIIVLPLIIKFFIPKVAPIQLPVSPSEPLHPTQTDPQTDDNSRPRAKPKHSAYFDLSLARVSLCIDLICYIGMAWSMSSLSWSTVSVARAFSGGFTPALQSVALVLYEKGPNQGVEIGKLFGGLSVVQALCNQIIGPSLFGVTYASTVDKYPKAIFVLAAGLVTLSLLFISLVQLPRAPPKTGDDREELTVEGAQGRTPL